MTPPPPATVGERLGLSPVSVAEVTAERVVDDPPEIPWHITPPVGEIALQLRSTVRRVAIGAGLARNSTLVEYSPAGAVLNTWSIKDKIDGMAADPLKHYVILTLDEDANTHLATVTPSAP